LAGGLGHGELDAGLRNLVDIISKVNKKIKLSFFIYFIESGKKKKLFG
jgi:hypothetical protein